MQDPLTQATEGALRSVGSLSRHHRTLFFCAFLLLFFIFFLPSHQPAVEALPILTWHHRPWPPLFMPPCFWPCLARGQRDHMKSRNSFWDQCRQCSIVLSRAVPPQWHCGGFCPVLMHTDARQLALALDRAPSHTAQRTAAHACAFSRLLLPRQFP